MCDSARGRLVRRIHMQLTSHLTAPSHRRQTEQLAQRNRALAAIPAKDFLLLAPYLRLVSLNRGITLHDAGDDIAHVYFPQTAIVSLVAVLQNGTMVETAMVGASGIVGATAAFGSRHAFGRAIV